MMRAMIPGGRVTVMNRDVTIRRDGTEERFQLEDRAALRDLLRTHFGFDCPEVEDMRLPTVPEWS
jgi:N-hydroxyarylamine O-acetyltransferase